MCKVWILEFGDFGFWGFWILGILDFGFWGSWILDFGLGILDGHLVTKFWMLHKKRRLCTPNRVGGFLMLLSTFIVDAKWHWQILGLMAHMATIAILVLGVGWFQTCSFLWAHIHVNQQKLAASVFLFSVSVARWNTLQVPGWQQYYWHVDWGQGCQSWS